MEIKIELSHFIWSLRIVITLFIYILFRLGNLEKSRFYLARRLYDIEKELTRLARPKTKTATYSKSGNGRKGIKKK